MSQHTKGKDCAKDVLFQIHAWLSYKLQTDTRHFGDSDRSGHPHGFDGVVIPNWDIKQKLQEIDSAIADDCHDELVAALRESSCCCTYVGTSWCGLWSASAAIMSVPEGTKCKRCTALDHAEEKS